MSKFIFSRNKKTTLKSAAMMFLSGSLVALLLVWSYLSFTTPASSNTIISHQTQPHPDLSYLFETPIKNWDEKRKQWLGLHPSYSAPGERVVMVTGSQPGPCKTSFREHLLLRFFKNKVDYCRIHGYVIYYHNVLLHQKMSGSWAKYPAVRAAMLAHPEAEWIYWVDSDAAFTDMSFVLPLGKYRAHNLVINGWAEALYKKRSWTGLNAGVFLIRNCQWSMDLLDRWGEFGPQSPDYEKWGPTLKSVFKDKLLEESDDQTALAYMLVKEGTKWGDKVYLEKEYYFSGYWVDIVETLEKLTYRYKELEKEERRLRKKHEGKGEEAGYGVQYADEELRRWGKPFITHFAGCQPCTGLSNKTMSATACINGMAKALDFADYQVLRSSVWRPDSIINSSLLPRFS